MADSRDGLEPGLSFLPEHWTTKTFGDLFDIQAGKALSKAAREGPRQRPFLRTANVLWGRVSWTTLDSMHFTEDESKKYALLPDDLLVCEGGEIGRAALWEGGLECFHQNHVHRCRAKPSEGVDPEFYMCWLEFAFRLSDIYAGRGSKTTIANLSKGRLAALPVAHPPFEEQQMISALLRSVRRSREATQQRQSALGSLFDSMLREFAAGRKSPEPIRGADSTVVEA